MVSFQFVCSAKASHDNLKSNHWVIAIKDIHISFFLNLSNSLAENIFHAIRKNTRRLFMRITVWLNSAEVACWDFSAENLEYLQHKIPQAVIIVCNSEAEFIQALPQTEIALTWNFKQQWFDIADSLYWIFTPAAGRDYFSIQPPEHVKVSHGSFHGELMAETVMAMILASCRGIIVAARDAEICSKPELSLTMRPLRGANLTILGFGAIGEWIGRLAKPFGVNITGIKRQMTSCPDYFDDDDTIVTVDKLNEVLPTTDHLVLVLPRNSGSELIINKQTLALLPPQAVIYNVGRGNAIDESALAEALVNKKIAGACLDVFATEPLPANSPLRNIENILLMPHSSAISPNYLSLFIDEFIAKITIALHR
jgi:phosphoglycerate dehydrogenase-like enzyme